MKDNDTVRYVWNGPRGVVSTGGAGGVFSASEHFGVKVHDNFIGNYYAVEGFPVRDSELQKYFRNYGYNLPPEFDIVTVDVGKEKSQKLLELRKQADSFCPTVAKTRETSKSLINSSRRPIGQKGIQAIGTDLANLEDLCSISFSYGLNGAFLITYKPLGDIADSLPKSSEVKAHFEKILENLSKNLMELQAEISGLPSIIPTPPTPVPSPTTAPTPTLKNDVDKPCRTFDEHPLQKALKVTNVEVDKKSANYGETVTIRGEISYMGPTASILGRPEIYLWQAPLVLHVPAAGVWAIDSNKNVVNIRSRPTNEVASYFCINAGDRFSFEITWDLRDRSKYVQEGNYTVDATITTPVPNKDGAGWSLDGPRKGSNVIAVKP